jgi:hypothetical protein
MIIKRILDSEREIYEKAIKQMGYGTGYSLRTDKQNKDGSPTEIDLHYDGDEIDHKYLEFIVSEIKNEK